MREREAKKRQRSHLHACAAHDGELATMSLHAAPMLECMKLSMEKPDVWAELPFFRWDFEAKER